jgi:hypothetical protein
MIIWARTGKGGKINYLINITNILTLKKKNIYTTFLSGCNFNLCLGGKVLLFITLN